MDWRTGGIHMGYSFIDLSHIQMVPQMEKYHSYVTLTGLYIKLSLNFYAQRESYIAAK